MEKSDFSRLKSHFYCSVTGDRNASASAVGGSVASTSTTQLLSQPANALAPTKLHVASRRTSVRLALSAKVRTI